MKRLIGIALAGGLAMLVGGCASSSGSSAGSSGATGAGAGTTAPAANTGSTRNFNLAVKCPGVHYMKTHGKSDSDVTQQLGVDQSDIPACEQWVADQPHGYVPPPPAGVAAAAPAAAASPAATKQ